MRDLVLGESLEVLIDHRGKTPKKLGVDFSAVGVPVASAMLVSDGRLHLEEARYVSEETAEKWMPVPLRRGDVLLTSEAPLGRVARVPSDEPLVLGQRLFGLRGKQGVLHTGYLYYALQCGPVQSQLVGRATGTTVVGIRQSALRSVKIPAPTFESQHAIAEVLGALDDKIAANRKVAATADALARAIFKRARWGATAHEVTYENIADIGGGGTPRTSVPEYWDGPIQWATPTDVTALNVPSLAETSRTITEQGLLNSSANLYPVGSILMTSRATIGAFAIAEIPVAVNQGFIVVNAKNPSCQWWLYHDMRSRVDEFISHANGATFLELPRGRFKNLPVQIPDDSVLAKFSTKAAELHRVASTASAESRTLGLIRDTLLPQLMSGRLRIHDAENAVESVL
ncbi:restriction endonuclease subunit S [Rhodococcus sp. 2H158]